MNNKVKTLRTFEDSTEFLDNPEILLNQIKNDLLRKSLKLMVLDAEEKIISAEALIVLIMIALENEALKEQIEKIRVAHYAHMEAVLSAEDDLK